jgi:hypothetical protein
MVETGDYDPIETSGSMKAFVLTRLAAAACRLTSGLSVVVMGQWIAVFAAVSLLSVLDSPGAWAQPTCLEPAAPCWIPGDPFLQADSWMEQAGLPQELNLPAGTEHAGRTHTVSNKFLGDIAYDIVPLENGILSGGPAKENCPSATLPITEEVARSMHRGISFGNDVMSNEHLMVDHTVAPAEFSQSAGDEESARPSYLDPETEEWSVSKELEQLKQRLDELEAAKVAQEDATRSIIRQSFAERGSNINDFVVFGGTLETLTYWAEDFDGVGGSDIVLDTAELDFEAQVNPWTLGSLVLQYENGTGFLFPTTQEDEADIDRINVRQAWITVGDTANYPLFGTIGRDVVPFGISTGDPVTDVLTINDPLTVEVFETTEDFVMIGFVGPTCCPPPASKTQIPARRVKPILINPLVRRTATRLWSYCPCTPPPAPTPLYLPPPTCTPPFNGAVYFYNGDTLDGGEDHIEHMGGTVGYFTKGELPYKCVPWSVDFDLDVNSSVFDSNFLAFEYRRFLDQIGYVPGMASHVKSSVGPVAMVVEWNGAISDATFTDDAGTDVNIRPNAWQFSMTYQFDWNPTVEIIGAQGTYFALGYSESDDLAGVTRVLAGDPLNPFRVGNVPERRLSVGMGEWVLDGLRVALEYSHVWDYDTGLGTGNEADGVFMQVTYEW